MSNRAELITAFQCALDNHIVERLLEKDPDYQGRIDTIKTDKAVGSALAELLDEVENRARDMAVARIGIHLYHGHPGQ